MKRFDSVVPYLPFLYLVGALSALAMVIAIGVVSTPLEGIANSGHAASILRGLLALPMPIALALYLGVPWRRAEFWIIVLLVGSLMIATAPLFVCVLIAIAIYLLFRPFLPTTTSEKENISSRNLLVWTIGIAAFTFALRLLVLNEPFERDLMVYAMVASSWLEGMVLYTDTWDHKPPGLYVAYAIAIGIFGQSPNAMLALGITTFTITLLGIKGAAERLYGPSAAVIAMLVWAAFGNDLILQAQQPNVEVFMNACLVWALVFLLSVAEDQQKYGSILAAGVLFFVASTFKQISVFPAFLIAIWLIWLSFSDSSKPMIRSLVRATGSVALFAIPGLLGWLLIFGVFYFSGHFGEFMYGAFGYNQSHAGSIFSNFRHMAFRDVTHPYYITIFLLLVLMSFSLTNRKFSLLICAVYIGGIIMVGAPGKNFHHYYQLLLPAMAIGIGVHVAKLVPGNKILGTALILLAPIWISFGYFTSPERVSFVKYDEFGHGGMFREAREVGKWLSKNMTSNDKVFHWGAEPGVYFWSGNPIEYRFSYSYPLFKGPRAEEFTEQVLSKIRCDSPEIVVASVSMVKSDHLISAFIDDNYLPYAQAPSFDFFQIWERRTVQPVCR